ncbi:MAG TPA: hypothetical protein VFG46_02215 [Chryseolinea sp.]|nr:hypothetical protein [Chryseolinea sp.]
MGKHVVMPGIRPPLEDGYTRIDYLSILAETEKAYLIQLEDKDVWVPRSQCKLHLVFYYIDIKNWFYEKNIDV